MSGRQVVARVGGGDVHAVVTGSGGPAVVLESGWGASSRTWEGVMDALAPETTVLAYDRPGYHDSSPARDRRTPADIAAGLDAVLDAVGLDGPLVLVGHSSGGIYVRAFAARHPERVAGMVLVDSAVEGQNPYLNPHIPRAVRLRQSLLLPRLALSRREDGGHHPRTLVRELRTLNALTSADRLPRGALGNRPLAVLTRTPGDPWTNDHTPAGAGAEPPSWRAWHDLHVGLLGLSTDARHTVAENAGHFIHLDEPALVLTAIRDVLHS